jgi:hypothetical protein
VLTLAEELQKTARTEFISDILHNTGETSAQVVERYSIQYFADGTDSRNVKGCQEKQSLGGWL